MILYFCRHANAGRSLPDPQRDARRALDPQGVAQARNIGRLLAAAGVSADAIWSSPLKRCMQTASLLANEIGYEGRVIPQTALLPQAGIAAFRSLLRAGEGLEAVILVGHKPSLAILLGRLIATSGAATRVALKKGGVAKVRVEARGARLEWLLTPKLAALIYPPSTAKLRSKTLRK